MVNTTADESQDGRGSCSSATKRAGVPQWGTRAATTYLEGQAEVSDLYFEV